MISARPVAVPRANPAKGEAPVRKEVPAKPGERQQTTGLGVVPLNHLSMQAMTPFFHETDLRTTSCGSRCMARKPHNKMFSKPCNIKPMTGDGLR